MGQPIRGIGNIEGTGHKETTPGRAPNRFRSKPDTRISNIRNDSGSGEADSRNRQRLKNGSWRPHQAEPQAELGASEIQESTRVRSNSVAGPTNSRNRPRLKSGTQGNHARQSHKQR